MQMRRSEARKAFATEGCIDESAVAPHELSQSQTLVAPPGDIGGITEGADHQDARAFLGIRDLTGKDRHRHPEERGDGFATEESAAAPLETPIVGP